jgi:hypothetical protein
MANRCIAYSFHVDYVHHAAEQFTHQYLRQVQRKIDKLDGRGAGCSIARDIELTSWNKVLGLVEEVCEFFFDQKARWSCTSPRESRKDLFWVSSVLSFSDNSERRLEAVGASESVRVVNKNFY